MKKFCAVALCCLSLLIVKSQFKIVGESQVFDEPDGGFSKLLLLKNGSTLFFHCTLKDGVDVKVFDPARKEKSNHFDPSYEKLKNANCEAAFEINGDVVVFISDVQDKTPILHRLVINGKTGGLKSQEQVAEVPKLNMRENYALSDRLTNRADFFVRKDPNSDYYALAVMKSFEGERNKNIEVTYYGPNNKPIGKATLTSPNVKYQYIEYIDMAVLGKDKINMLAFASTTTKKGEVTASSLVLCSVASGGKTTMKEIDFAKNYDVTGGIVRVNPVTNKMITLAAVKSETDRGKYDTYIGTLDLATETMENFNKVHPLAASTKNQAIFGKKNPYAGYPQNLFVNNDGSYSVVFEEMSATYTRIEMTTSVSTMLGTIAVANYDKEGAEINSYLLPKSQKLYDDLYLPFYHSQMNGSAQKLNKGNQFKSFSYLNGKEKLYILFNDVEENIENIPKGKLQMVSGVGGCEAFYFNLAGDNVVPDRQFVFGKPEKKSEHQLCLFAISDYNRETNQYVTMKLEKDGRDKAVKIVWMQP